jgi:hypothetical protein
VLASIMIATGSATAQKKYDPGVTEEPSKFTYTISIRSLK